MDVLNLIVNVRSKHKLTQKKLSNILAVDYLTVNRWANKHRSPNESNIKLLEYILSISTDDLNDILRRGDSYIGYLNKNKNYYVYEEMIKNNSFMLGLMLKDVDEQKQ